MSKKYEINPKGESRFAAPDEPFEDRHGLVSPGGVVVLCICYAAKKVGFQEGKLTKEQMLQCALPYGDPVGMTMERAEALRQAVVASNEACWDLLAPARGMVQ